MKFVKVDKAIKTKHPKLGEVSIEGEFPQVESFEELHNFCGGEDKALEYVNAAIEAGAKNSVRTGGRAAAEDITMGDLQKKLVEVLKNYTPGSTRAGTGTKAKAAKFDELANLIKSGQDLTKEQLMAIIEGSK